MKNLGRALLIVGVLVLVLLVGVLVGRGQRAQPTSEGNAAAVQITTAPPPVAPPEPLPAAVPTPPPVAPPKIAIDEQVQEDAAAVGMTTRDDAAPAGDAEPAPKSAGADAAAGRPQG